MKVLVLCDDRWHPAETVKKGLSPLENNPYQFDWIEDAGEWSSERMMTYPVVILSKSDNITAQDERSWLADDVQKAFSEYVQAGNGLLTIHSGTVVAEIPIIRRLIGGTFLNHPEQCPVTVTTAANHPMTVGTGDFTKIDEHYMMA